MTARTRERVLAVIGELDDSSVPATLRTLGDRLDLSPSTLRFHLTKLIDEGVVEALPHEVDTPGRRPLRYRRTATAPAAGESNYRLLAQILSTALTEHVKDAEEVCEEAGTTWGTYLAHRTPPDQRVEDEQVIEQLGFRLTELGFHPERVGEEIRLRNCPFRAVAESRRDVACTIHLGLMRGIVDVPGSAVTVEELVPFATPQHCTVRLGRTEPRR